MDENCKTATAPWQSLGPKKWISVIVGGLVLGEAVWVAIVSLTRDVILPLMAMALGEDTSSPLSLGKQDFNFPDLFTAFLELCLAGLLAIVVYAWIQKKPKAVPTRSLSSRPATAELPQASPAPQITAPAFTAAAATQTGRTSATQASGAPSPSSPVFRREESTAAPAIPQTPAAATAEVAARPSTAVTAAKPQSPPAPVKSKPAKPEAPKPVYYNIVGERITPPDDDDTSAQ